MYISILLFLFIIFIIIYIHYQIHGDYPEPVKDIMPYLERLKNINWNKIFNQDEIEDIPNKFNDYDELIIETPTLELEEYNDDINSIISMDDDDDNINNENQILNNFLKNRNNQNENVYNNMKPLDPNINNYDDLHYTNSREIQMRISDPPTFVKNIGNNMINVDPDNQRNIKEIQIPSYISDMSKIEAYNQMN
jgi:hypothetical protein